MNGSLFNQGMVHRIALPALRYPMQAFSGTHDANTRCLSSRMTPVVAAAVTLLLLIIAANANAVPDRATLTLTLPELRTAAARYAPGAVLPNKLPPGINQADVGAFCNAPGLGGPPCRWMIGYESKRAQAEAFHLGIYQGRVAAKVVQALLRHDGKAGSVAPFTAGRFTGTRERQRDARYKVGRVDSYVWQTGKWTYLVEVHYRESGGPDYPGTNPEAIIASFSASGPKASPPVAPVYATVPNLVGMTQAQAVAALRALDLIPRVHVYAGGPADQFGLVVHQRPSAGSSLRAGSPVDVDVSA